VPIQPFYQWENNYGYCGEVSLMEAALANGEWISQYDTRLLCGTGLGQSERRSPPTPSAPPTAILPITTLKFSSRSPTLASPEPPKLGDQCRSAREHAPQFHLLPLPGRAASQPHALCTGSKASSSCPGYQSYLSWVKQQVINGNTVAIAVLIQDESTPGDQYDHEVTVVKDWHQSFANRPDLLSDDVLYFEEHGVYWYNGTIGQDYSAPEPPPGAGSNTSECTPYIFGYPFSDLGATDAQAQKAWHVYSIVLPANTKIVTGTGYNGMSAGAASGARSLSKQLRGCHHRCFRHVR